MDRAQHPSRRVTAPRPPTPADYRASGHIYFEFVRMGAVVKATAIDAASGREASIVGPASTSREALAHAAAQKLAYVLNKQSGEI